MIGLFKGGEPASLITNKDAWTEEFLAGVDKMALTPFSGHGLSGFLKSRAVG